MFGCAHCSFSLYRIRIYLASSVLKLPLCRVVPNLRSMTCFFECMKLCFDCLRSQQGSLRRFESLGGLGEGSGWDLRVRPAPAASGNLEIWNFGNLVSWKSGNLEIREPGNLEIWDQTTSKKWKFSKSKSVSPKMYARSGLVGKKASSPVSMPFQAFSHGPEKSEKNVQPMFAMQPVWGPCCYPPLVGPNVFPK